MTPPPLCLRVAFFTLCLLGLTKKTVHNPKADNIVAALTVQCSDINIEISTASAVVVTFSVVCQVLAIPQTELHSMFDEKTLVRMAVGHGEYEDR